MSVYRKARVLLDTIVAIPGITPKLAVALWLIAIDVWCLAAAARVAMLRAQGL